MSTIRSTSRRAPATDPFSWRNRGLLLVGHGSERCIGPNKQLLEQAAQLRASGKFGSVEAAVLYGAPSLDQAMARFGEQPVHVVPMFMCDGMFTQRIIPEKIEQACLKGQHVSYEQPIGLSSGMVNLISRRIQRTVTDDGFLDTDVTVLIVGHGSTASDASFRTTERHARDLRTQRVFRSVETAYLDQFPHIGKVLPSLRGRIYVVGLFAAEGSHAQDDIPEAIGKAPNRNNIHYLGPIGADAAMIDLVIEQLGV